MSIDERLAERTRADDPLEMTRSTDFWFDDGSIVLQVESTQYRVAKTILAMHSTVFADMLSLPVPQTQEEPLVEGCPVVVLPDDKSEDWDCLLRVIYPKSCFIQDEPLVEEIAGVLRLSKKYDIPQFRRQAIRRLTTEFPSSFDGFKETQEGWSTIFVPDDCTPVQYNVKVIKLARAVGLYSVLPLAYYHICAVAVEKGIHNSSFLALDLADQAACLNGYTKLTRTYLETPLVWLSPSAKCAPCEHCTRPASCREAAARELAVLLSKSDYIASVLDSWSESTWEDIFCEECVEASGTRHAEEREKCWDRLPSYFGLPAWEELLQMDLE
ncbi:BTB domain-containing protein [Mycena kentingensis (nom. inval.)]|nr:BTB domain-containing protein [Mycena kentingensis (nom. inval.)]